MQKFRNFFSNFFSNFLPELFSNIKQSYHLAWNGKENLKNVFYLWGGLAYIGAFLANKLVRFNTITVIDWLICSIVIAYFVAHIIVVRRCTPKKPPLSKEEKEQRKKDRFKRFYRKLFLQEPLTKWDSSKVVIAADIYVILYFFEYLIK